MQSEHTPESTGSTPQKSGRISSLLNPLTEIFEELKSFESRLRLITDAFIGQNPPEDSPDISKPDTTESFETKLQSRIEAIQIINKQILQQVSRLETL